MSVDILTYCIKREEEETTKQSTLNQKHFFHTNSKQTKKFEFERFMSRYLNNYSNT